MLDLLWLVPALPFAGFLVLALAGRRLPRRGVAVVGVGSVGLAAAVTVGVAVRFLAAPPPGDAFLQPLWRWLEVGGFHPAVALYLDPLSLVMTLVVTGVGFLIHLYSAEFMAEDADYARFFAAMNLFVGSMLMLVLASDLLLLYLGWEGVGLCSYLLIGFWYQDAANGAAARKAFIVTRVGDTAMALGLFLLLTRLGTLDIQEVLHRAAAEWPVGSTLAVATAALLLGGALGKSAQLPLQTWLPDAMAGPTPVSALIHAATMVTAGVYLIARTHTLFALAPPVRFAVAVIGAVTLLVAGASALVQRDIKRILAYSTISQIGYMFLGLGVGAWSAAIFHLMTHAFFKALLFLGAGAVILTCHHEHDIFRMGGLKEKLPTTFWTFLAGAAALAGVPLVTAGFFSKDLILWQAFHAPRGGTWLWAAGLVGAFLTALYAFRLVFIAFFGEPQTQVTHRPGRRILLPLGVLAALSVVGGWIELPGTLGDLPLFSRFLAPVFGEAHGGEHGLSQELLFQLLASVASLGGIYLAYRWFLVGRREQAPFVPPRLAAFWLAGWRFDDLYDALLVRPFVTLAHWGRNDLVDTLYTATAAITRGLHRLLATTQTGHLRWYAATLAFGTVVILYLVLTLSP